MPGLKLVKRSPFPSAILSLLQVLIKVYVKPEIRWKLRRFVIVFFMPHRRILMLIGGLFISKLEIVM